MGLTIDKDLEFLYLDLFKSGISKEYLEQNLINGNILPQWNNGQVLTGYKICYLDIDGNKTNYYNMRQVCPINDKKYIKPKGEKNRIFYPYGMTKEDILNVEKPLLFVEGEKKVLSAFEHFKENEQLANILPLGLAGVFGWKIRNNNENIEDITSEDSEDTDIVADLRNGDLLNGRVVYLCFDSDIVIKKPVMYALRQLSAYLLSKGAKVFDIRLPQCIKGLDDYLVEFNADSFADLVENAKEITFADLHKKENEHTCPTFPLDIFAKPLENEILQLSKFYNCDYSFIMMNTLVYTSCCMCGKYTAIAREGWIVDCNLYATIVAEPSSIKSPVFNAFKTIIDKIEKGYNESEIKMPRYYRETKEAKKNGTPLPERPRNQRLYVSDSTTEALAVVMDYNMRNFSRGLYLLNDELSSTLENMSKYSKSNADEDFYISSYHRGTNTIIRLGRDIDKKYQALLGIFGTTQFQVCQKLLLNKANATNNGFMQRFLLCPSKYKLTSEIYKQNKGTKFCIKTVEDTLFNIALSEDKDLTYLLSNEASELYDQYYCSVIDSKLKLTDIQAQYLQKVSENVLKFSLIIEVVNNTVMGVNNVDTEISAESMEKAINLGHYFFDCFNYIVATNQQYSKPMETVLSYIKTQKCKEAKLRELVRGSNGLFKKNEDVLPVLKDLQALCYGRIQTVGKTLAFVCYDN